MKSHLILINSESKLSSKSSVSEIFGMIHSYQNEEAKFLSIFGPIKFRNKLSVYKSNGETFIDRTDIHILQGGNWKE